METPKLSWTDFRVSLWPSWMIVILGLLISRLPMPIIFSLGKGLGQLFYLVSRRRRHITEVNLSLCFPEILDEEHKKLVKESFTQVGIGLVELLIPWLNPSRDLSNLIDIHGAENLTTALDKNKGVIIVGGHFAALDIIVSALCSLGPVDCMYRFNKNPVWEWLQVRGRQRFFGRVIEREEMKATLQCLKDGRAIWYGADQDYGARHSVFAPFFNIEAATIITTSRLSRVNDSPVIFLRQYRNTAQGRWEIHFSSEMDGFPSGDNYTDATKINSFMEDAIKIAPAQYLWMHRRFKTRPEGQKSLY